MSSDSTMILLAPILLAIHEGVKLTEEQVAMLRSYVPKPTVMVATAAVATVPVSSAPSSAPSSSKRKPKTTKSSDKPSSKKQAEEGMLLPVLPTGMLLPEAKEEESMPAPTAAAAAENVVINVVATVDHATVAHVDHDHLKGHKYRLATINPIRCRGRKVAEKTPIPGTETSHAQSNGKFFPELQCIRKVTGSLLCETCCTKDAEYKADPSNFPKAWFGRLDEPMYPRALVVGSQIFFEKYPQGLPEDPSTAAPAEWLAANPTTKKPAKATKKVAKAAAVAAVTETVTETVAATETVVATETVAAVAETVAGTVADDAWSLVMIECRSHIVEKATGKCYLAKTDGKSASYKDMVDLENYEGIYNAETETLEQYGCEGVDE